MTLMPVFDGHNDTLLKLLDASDEKTYDFFARNDTGHIDLPRAREGGLMGGLFAIFVQHPEPIHLADRLSWNDDKTAYRIGLDAELDQPHALRRTIKMMALMLELARKSDGQVHITRTVAEIRAAQAAGALAIVPHIEGIECLSEDLHELDVLYAAGLRSLGPVWSRPNIFGTGVPFVYPADPDEGPGLTDAGKALVRRCNELGIMIDLSHLNAAGFWDVAELSTAPLVATHSNVHAICPSTRNLTDDQLDAIGKSGGMVGLNYFVGLLRPDGQWEKDMPLSVMADHIAYIADRIGIDHVGLGSDFDGASVADDLKDAAGLPRLIDALRERGFDEAAVRKIAHENWLRVLRETWGA